MAKSFEVDLQNAEAAEKGEARDAASGSPSFGRLFVSRLAGAGVAAPPRPTLKHTSWSFVGSFLALAALGLGHHFVSSISEGTFKMIIPPFGAMAVLVFSAHKSPFAQPRNVILGNTIGAIVGYIVWSSAAMIDAYFWCDDCGMLCSPTSHLWLTAALAVSLTIYCQQRFNAVHPPGGATAMLYVIMPPLRDMAHLFILCPSFVGACLLVVCGMLINNLSQNRAYPQTYWTARSPLTEITNQQTSVQASRLGAYLQKFGGAEAPPATPRPSVWSFVGSFVGIAVLALFPRAIGPICPMFPEALVLGLEKLLIGSFGAMAVLVFGAPKAPLAQPKNVVAGNAMGALAGVLVVQASALLAKAHFPESPNLIWLKAAFAVSLTIAGQEVCSVVHPPGAATAMIFVLMRPLQELGFLYVLIPGVFGAVLLVCVGLVTNNLSKAGGYPQRWT